MPYTMWKYAYAVPGDMMTAVAVLPPEAQNDYSTRFSPAEYPYYNANFSPMLAAGQYVPQRYSIETDTLGNKVLYTDQENALLRYQALVNDPTKFDPSGQEATLYSRVQSKMSDQEVYEHGLSPVPVGAIMPFPVLGKIKKRK